MTPLDISFVGDCPSPLCLPPPLLLMNSMERSKRKRIVDWSADGTKVQWSDEELESMRKPNKRTKAIAKPRRIVIAAEDTVRTAVLAAKRTFEHVFFVSLVDKLGHLAGGTTEVGNRQLEVSDVKLLCSKIWEVAQSAAVLMASEDTCLIVVDQHGENWAKLFSTLVRNILRVRGNSMGSTSKPVEKAFCYAAKTMNSAVSELCIKGAIYRLADDLR